MYSCAAASIVASCNSSLEPKWRNNPLLLICISLARRPIVRPSSPSLRATCLARATIAARVSRRRRSRRGVSVVLTDRRVPAQSTNVRAYIPDALWTTRSGGHAHGRFHGEADRRDGGGGRRLVQARPGG